jgi:membrane protein DedA with SNARE-associated domain
MELALSFPHLPLHEARHLLDQYGYLALFLSLVIEYLVFFIPGETFVIMAAAYATTGRMSLPLVILAAALGAAIGSNNAYWIGRWGGHDFLLAHANRFRVSNKSLGRLERFFQNHGASAVFWLRFVTVLRILVGYFAGVNAVRFEVFTLFNILGAVTWATLIAVLGYAFAHNLHLLRTILTDTGLVVLAVAAVVGVFLWTRHERTD